MKKAFTLTEMLITLTIISIVAAIIIPVLFDTLPNKTAYLYKTAFKIVENTVGELMNSSTMYPTSTFENATDDTYFCRNFTSKINTLEDESCTINGNVTVPNFTTTNGIKWWGFKNTFTTEPVIISMDVDGNESTTDSLTIKIYKNGKLAPGGTTESDYLRKLRN